jgi:hypothetical protein
MNGVAGNGNVRRKNGTVKFLTARKMENKVKGIRNRLHRTNVHGMIETTLSLAEKRPGSKSGAN